MRRMGALAVLSAVAACGGPGASGGRGPDAERELAAGRGIGFDDLAWSASLGRVLVAAGDVGLVFLLSADLETLETLSAPEMKGPYSADEGSGRVFVADRATNTILVFDAQTRVRIGGAAGGGSIDYVRYCAATHEIWVSEPSRAGIEVFALAADGTPSSVAFIETAGWAEGLAIDSQNGIAVTHAGGGRLAIVDVRSRAVRTVDTGCSNLHGIPAYDPALRHAFAGCGSTAQVAVVDLVTNSLKGRAAAAGHTTVLGYSPTLHHFYLKADPGVPVTVLGVGADGVPITLGTFDAQMRGHAVVTDADGHLFVPDADRGRLLRFTDDFPVTP
jgi:hypothetical protein